MNLQKFDLKNLDFTYPAILLFLFVFTYLYVFDAKLFLGGDNAQYYILGKAIAEGYGYQNIAEVFPGPATHYPPGFPAIIAGIQLLFPESITAVKIFNGLFFLISILLFYGICSKLTDNKHLAFTGTAFVVVNASVLEYTFIMMSEIPFLMFSLCTIYLFTRIDRKEHILKNKFFYLFILSLSFSYYVRTQGLALVGGILLCLLIRRNFALFSSTFLGFFILASPWQIWTQIHGGGSYLNPLLLVNPYRPELGTAGIYDIAIRVVENLYRYTFVEIPIGIFPFWINDIDLLSTWSYVAGILCLGLIIYGLYLVKNYRLIIGCYLLGTFGILLLWPEGWTGIRFIIPIIPFLVVLLLNGLIRFIDFILIKLSISKRIHSGFLFIFLLIYVPNVQALHVKSNQGYYNNWSGYFNLALWVKEHTNKDVIIGCRKPGLFYLFSNRRATRYLYTLEDETLINDLKKNNVKYVVVDDLGFSSTPRYLVPVVKKYRNYFKMIARDNNSKNFLFEFTPNNQSE